MKTMVQPLEARIALVTGASHGIGETIAVRFAQEGADVVINYRSDPEGAASTLAKVEGTGRNGLVVPADVGSADGVATLMKTAVEHFGRVDILVNNAGVEKHAPFWEVTEKDYDTVIDVNLKGVFFATQAFVKALMAQKRPGTIINISSVHEELPFPNFTAYCASKGGVKMLTRNLGIELAPHGITINSIAPGAIETPINTALLNDPTKLKALLENIPLNRLGKPADVSSAVAFLASSDADYITGTTLVVDGGLTWNYSEQ